MEQEYGFIDKTDKKGIYYRIRKNDNVCIKLNEFGINDLVKIKETVIIDYGYIFHEPALIITELDPYDTRNLVIKCCPINLKRNLVKDLWIWVGVNDLEIVKKFDPTESINKLVKKIKKIETENNKNTK